MVLHMRFFLCVFATVKRFVVYGLLVSVRLRNILISRKNL